MDFLYHNKPLQKSLLLLAGVCCGYLSLHGVKLGSLLETGIMCEQSDFKEQSEAYQEWYQTSLSITGKLTVDPTMFTRA